MNAFTKNSRTLFNRAFFHAKKFSSSAGQKVEQAGGPEPIALAAVGTTFVTYMCADFLSNFLQHPTQKVCYYMY